MKASASFPFLSLTGVRQGAAGRYRGHNGCWRDVIRPRAINIPLLLLLFIARREHEQVGRSCYVLPVPRKGNIREKLGITSVGDKFPLFFFYLSGTAQVSGRAARQVPVA